jgi:hypothetical protein
MKQALAALAGVSALALMSAPSHAILQIAAQVNGGAIFTCQDNQAGCDTNSNIGTLTLGRPRSAAWCSTVEPNADDRPADECAGHRLADDHQQHGLDGDHPVCRRRH